MPIQVGHHNAQRQQRQAEACGSNHAAGPRILGMQVMEGRVQKVEAMVTRADAAVPAGSFACSLHTSLRSTPPIHLPLTCHDGWLARAAVTPITN